MSSEVNEETDPPLESDSAQNRGHWWGVIGLVFFGWVVVQFVGSLAFVSIADGRDFSELSGTEVFWVTIPFQASLGVAALAIANWSGSAFDLVRLREWRLTDIPLGLLVGLAMQFGIGIIYLFYVDLIGRDADAASDLVEQFSGTEIVLLFITAGVVAPVVEELFFRGVLQGALERLTRPWLAVAVAATVFAASHFQLVELLGLLLFALLVGYLVRRTGRLSFAIFTHIGFNLTSLTALLFL
ncbi:MAG: CPBP family intramembrane metalloprotease [Actinomycetia bacterium]|nr:CPBP family intramembrane metalloprotease [Actinomycetes bacterium]